MARKYYPLDESPQYEENIEQLLNTDPVLAESGFFYGLILRILNNIKAVYQRAVPTSRTINGKPLTTDITLTKEDMGLGSVSDTPDSEKLVAHAATAGAAAKLSTPRTIALSGGATGTATAFDGSANITIPITGLNMSNANAGTLPVSRGGTGATSAAAARTALGVAYGTAAGTVCQGNDSRLSNARTPTAHNQAASTITAGTFPGVVVANSNASYTTRQVRNIVMYAKGTSAPATQNGDVLHEYK